MKSKAPKSSGLGPALKKLRRDAKLSQSALAARAGLHRNAVVAVEGGRGGVETLVALAAALGMEIAGRAFTGKGGLGPQLLALRKRRRHSRRVVAELSGISIPSVEALERTGSGHLVTLEATGRALGAGLCLVPTGTELGFWSSAAKSSANVEWYTPKWLLERVNQVVGPFDVDPCSPGRGKSHVKASLHFTAQDDGLSLDWPGTVWMNPPYGRSIGEWMRKANEELKAGHARCVIALVPARTDTRWWHDHVVELADVVFLKGRVTFGEGTAAAPFPSALVAYGLTEAQKVSFSAAFSDSWRVPAISMAEDDIKRAAA